jgi:hypothetical protein
MTLPFDDPDPPFWRGRLITCIVASAAPECMFCALMPA